MTCSLAAITVLAHLPCCSCSGTMRHAALPRNTLRHCDMRLVAGRKSFGPTFALLVSEVISQGATWHTRHTRHPGYRCARQAVWESREAGCVRRPWRQCSACCRSRLRRPLEPKNAAVQPKAAGGCRIAGVTRRGFPRGICRPRANAEFGTTTARLGSSRRPRRATTPEPRSRVRVDE